MQGTLRIVVAALTLVALSLAAPPEARAVHTTYWIVTSEEDFKDGSLEKVSLERPGAVLLSPALTPIGGGGALYGWSLVRDGADIYLGTGDEGKVYRIPQRGEPIEWFDSIEMEILSLASDGKGRLYAGGSPDGTIYKITGQGAGTTFIDTPENYIWAMVTDGSGNLYAATGPRGLIYKVDASGNGEVFFDAHDKNVLSLLYDARRNALIAGTEGRGLVIQIGMDGKGRVLFDSGHEEIGALAIAPDGTIYAAGSGAGESKDRAGEANGGSTESAKKTDGEADPSAGTAKKNASIYSITAGDVVKRLWQSHEEFIYGMVIREDGNLVAGSGNEGALYEVTRAGHATLLTKFEESQVLDLVASPSGVIAATGNLANVYRVGPGRERAGTARSIVYDARNVSQWGSVSWLAETPASTKVTLRTRTGNTDKPDETWSEWSAPLTDGTGSKIADARSRFIQWEAELSSDGGDATPRLLEVRVSFVEANLAPLVADVEVFPQGAVMFEGDANAQPGPIFQVFPNGTRVQFEVDERQPQVWNEASVPWSRGIRSMHWDALDPNGDGLVFDIYYRALDEKRWKLLKKDHDKTYFAFESEALSDGEYEARVVASDRPDNAESEADSAEAVSEPFFVDNTAPEIASISGSRGGDGRLAIRAAARDARSFLKRAEYVVDAESWRPIAAEDGIFDSRAESFNFTTDKLDEGEHTVVIKVFDSAGNTQVSKVVVR
ncbi:MAG: hypothetical protein ACKVU1_12600 [bacterium]